MKTKTFRWSALLWALIYPRRRQRIGVTLSGALLIGLSFGVGSAAYNAGDNILFITLSLLLACLVLSGVLSWLNIRRTKWRLRIVPPLRVGQEAVATVVVTNEKHLLPTYGLWFDLSARAVTPDDEAKPETTFTAKGAEVKSALAQAERGERGRVFLETRLDPYMETRVEWVFRPTERGLCRVELESIGSLFPFGFLKKSFALGVSEDVVVWPAPVEYRRFAMAAARRPMGGERVAKVGTGSDLLALRRYELGDSHRLIHWKASARSRRLLVRQFAAESAEGFSLWVETDAARWSRAEQFELLISFAATLAEDLFRAERLIGAAIDDSPPMPVRRVRDLETFLDRLAVAKPASDEKSWPVAVGRGEDGAAARAGRRNLITFAPDGVRGVAAILEGRRIAAA